MTLLLEILLLALAALITVPILVLFSESLAALFARKPKITALAPLPPKITVLISAHNEELLIQSTVRSLTRQLRPEDQLLVVADNCIDRTAELAKEAGATVLHRQDPNLRGKGHGLNFGLQHLKSQPAHPDVVILFDADMEIEPGVVQWLAREAMTHNRPIQAEYIQHAPKNAGPKASVSTLAFIVKNAVRPAGLDWLGIPCALTGTGMAFAWNLIESAPLASGHLVEDMELGLHFLRAGKGPKFCPSVAIHGQLPADNKSAYIQRTRWEHGHLGIIRAHAFPLFFSGLLKARIDMIAAALDLAVPPLALLAGLWSFAALLAATFGIIAHLWLPALILAAAGALMLIAILLAWRQHARHLPFRALLAVPLYVLWKIPLYFKFLFRKQTAWVRTARPGNIPVQTDGASTT